MESWFWGYRLEAPSWLKPFFSYARISSVDSIFIVERWSARRVLTLFFNPSLGKPENRTASMEYYPSLMWSRSIVWKPSYLISKSHKSDDASLSRDWRLSTVSTNIRPSHKFPDLDTVTPSNGRLWHLYAMLLPTKESRIFVPEGCSKPIIAFSWLSRVNGTCAFHIFSRRNLVGKSGWMSIKFTVLFGVAIRVDSEIPWCYGL